MSFLSIITNKLDTLDWKDLSTTFNNIQLLLNDICLEKHLLKEYLLLDYPKRLLDIAAVSHETSTHYKWFIHKNQDLGYSIWLHEYKNRFSRIKGYAEVPHNHRYWFCSLVLKGGFVNSIYSIERSLNDPDRHLVNMATTDERQDVTNTSYIIDPDTIHSLSKIEEPTLTLIIRSKAVKDYSESFTIDNSIITQHHPFSSRMNLLQDIVKDI